MINKMHRVVITILILLGGMGAYAVSSLHPVAPALALSCAPVMSYKVLSEKYQPVIAVLEHYWDTSFATLKSTISCEQALEELFTEIKKTGFNGHDYIGMLELDIQTIERTAYIPEKLPLSASWLPEALKKFHTTLSLIRTLLQEHRAFSLLTEVQANVNGAFSREFALLKAKQQITLLEYMRTGKRDYAKDLMLWQERIVSALALAASRYPILLQSGNQINKQLTLLKQVYAKI